MKEYLFWLIDTLEYGHWLTVTVRNYNEIMQTVASYVVVI